MRKAVEGRESTLTEAEALEIMETCLKVLFYRDARSLNKVSALRNVESTSTDRTYSVPNGHCDREGCTYFRIALRQD